MRSAATALAVLAALAAGCGGEDAPRERPGVSINDPGVSHIHGIGVNAADRSLVIATHSGLFEAPAGQLRPTRIGDSRQDTMGFTVVGSDVFLGSGHPDLSELRGGSPPLLGLIRSDDAGRTWKSVSLRGEADFHTLRVAGSRIYAVNATDGRLMVSDDGGRRWARRSPPGAVVDLAPRPGRPDEVLAATADGIYVSANAGATWRLRAAGLSGLMAWPGEDALYVVGADGATHRSRDRGRTWQQVGSVGEPAAVVADGADLYVALHTNEVMVSGDGGRSWRLRARA